MFWLVVGNALILWHNEAPAPKRRANGGQHLGVGVHIGKYKARRKFDVMIQHVAPKEVPPRMILVGKVRIPNGTQFFIPNIAKGG